jgi:hypothetical protein
VVVDERVVENSTLDECERNPLRLEVDNGKYTKIVLACAWRMAVKKCLVGGFGTVDARIPFNQSVAWGPTMEMSPLLERRAVEGPTLKREATAGGNLGMGD